VSEPSGVRVAGVDGCKAGWIAVLADLSCPGVHELLVASSFAGLLAELTGAAVIAVDMPIGLPDRIGPTGRGAEKAVRKHLGQRQSSVFSVPSRSAVYAPDYVSACAIALETSEPPKKVSKQCYYLFPKIREIDALMTPSLEDRVFEVHPELAFWRLNGEEAMSLPKKVKSRPNGPGLDQRRDLLVSLGFDQGFLDQTPPRGAGRDDLLDAAANCLIAERITQGRAEPFPKDFRRDGKGLRMAIWA
jgi:predicted RNase H-like nuclease